MTLYEAVALARADVDAFESLYRAGMQATPETFPAEMDEQEWFEQYLVYLTMEE